MDQNRHVEPRFSLPLNESGLVLIGRTALMWSQVEFFIDEILALAYGLHVTRLRTLMGDRLTGQRIDILENSTDSIKNIEAKTEAKTLTANLKKIRPDRNHIMHGVWGWYNPDHDQYEAAALSHKRQEPFSHEKLVAHHDAIAAETHRVVDIFLIMLGVPKGSWHTNFYYGPTLRPRPQPLTSPATPDHSSQTLQPPDGSTGN